MGTIGFAWRMPFLTDTSNTVHRRLISLYTHSYLWVRKKCWETKFGYVNKMSYLQCTWCAKVGLQGATENMLKVNVVA